MSSFDSKALYFFRKSSPLVLDDAPEQLATALSLWRERGQGQVPTKRSIPVTDLPPKLIGNTHLIDVEYGDCDALHYRMRLYGTAIPVQTSIKPEGRLVTELGLGELYEAVFLADYNRVVQSRRPSLHLYEGMLDDPDIGRPYTYTRLILPLSDEEGRVVVLMVMSKTLSS
jgi:hypothetical protein